MRIQWLEVKGYSKVAVVSATAVVPWGANDYPTFFNPGYFWEGVMASSVSCSVTARLGNSVDTIIPV